ncbi:hypothetical protein MRX96_045162 [Rhipicephalus microplus]
MNLQVLRPMSLTLTLGMAIHKRGTEPSSASDSFEADPNHLSTTVARSESMKDSNSNVSLSDSTTGSDSTTSSPDSSRDTWLVDTSASDEQDSSERETKSDEVGQVALSTKDHDFPPLPRGPSCEASFDDTPIQSRGHYVLSEIPSMAPGPSLHAAADAGSREGTSSIIMYGTDPVRDEG